MNERKQPIKIPRDKILIMVFFTEGIVLVIALLLAKYFEISLSPISNDYSRDFILGASLASIPLIFFVFVLSKTAEKISFLKTLKLTLVKDIKAMFDDLTITDTVIISCIAGIAEELLFRGVIQAKLGIPAASIIFGLLHFITPTYFIIATLMGFYIGIMYEVHESLLIPIQLHFVYDLGALIYLKYFTSDQINHE